MDPKTPAAILSDALEQGAQFQLPEGRVPGYAVDDFKYVVSQGNETAWRMIAKRAFLYRAEHLMHGTQVEVFIENHREGEKPTRIVAAQAKFVLDSRHLDFKGNVKVTFPDGFELRSELLSYDVSGGRFYVPDDQTVIGGGLEGDGLRTAFRSDGLDYRRETGRVMLKRAVEVELERSDAVKKNRGVPERTLVKSDHAEVDRQRSEIAFRMSPRRRVEEQFVKATEPSLEVTSRRIRLRYRKFSEAPSYMRAEEDVTIRERDDPSKYATSGVADFDRERDVIYLTEFPQVYQGQDTVTGDRIVLHRASDVVEVSRSNAYSAEGH